MDKNIFNQRIIIKKYIDENDYEQINGLKELCSEHDKVNLKLELDFKLQLRKDYEKDFNNANEYLYYVNDKLAGYLAISSFGGNAAEINGVVHPNWRRRGIFTKLCELAVEESRRRDFAKILLLCDDKSNSAVEFIEKAGGVYSFSETGMKLSGSKQTDYHEEDIILRKAKNSDSAELQKQNSVFFGGAGSEPISPEEEEKNGSTTYIVELQGKAIGKIKISINEASGFISGFGILPEYRGKGFGRQALRSAINILTNASIYDIGLDVASKNKTALNLYKSCGFEEISTMNYYEIK